MDFLDPNNPSICVLGRTTSLDGKTRLMLMLQLTCSFIIHEVNAAPVGTWGINTFRRHAKDGIGMGIRRRPRCTDLISIAHEKSMCTVLRLEECPRVVTRERYPWALKAWRGF